MHLCKQQGGAGDKISFVIHAGASKDGSKTPGWDILGHIGTCWDMLGGQLGEQQGGRERSLNGSFLWARAMAGWVRRGRPALPACEMDVWRPNVPDNALLSRISAFYLLIAMQFQSME